jgi:hypothetical protein
MNAALSGVRGTLIVCDHVYQDRSGKFIIAGTYSAWRTREDELRIAPFAAYVRLQVDRPGDYPCTITVIDRIAAPNQTPLLRLDMHVHIGEAQIPVCEAAIQLPDLRIRAPVPAAERAPGSLHMIRTLVLLTSGDQDIASCPLDFQFVPPA